MTFKSVLLLLFTLIIYVKGNCNILDPDFKDEWEKGDIWIDIPDYEKNYKIEIESENIISVNIIDKYIEASVVADKLIFKAKDEFQNYIKNEKNTEYKITNPTYGCKDGSKKNAYLTLNVTETINYPPTFEQQEYKFKLAMPIAPNLIVDSTAMMVTDYNIDESLTFSFIGGDSECTLYFDFDTLQNNKIYTTKLKTKDYVNLEKNITCDVQVKDKREGMGSSKIVIEVDVQNSKVPNPMFKEPISIVNYDENLKVELELISQTYTPKPKIYDSTGIAKYFKSSVTPNNKIEIELKESIPEEELGDKNYFVLIVEAEYEKADKPGKTAILVDLNKNSATTTTSTSTETPECTTTIIPTTPCDCSSTSPDPENATTTTISTTSETDTSSCPSCPDCTTTIDPGNTSTCPSNPECPETTTSPGESTTCPPCPETTTSSGEETTATSGEGTTCPPCPETTSPGGSTTCPVCPETTLPGESTTCPSNPECPSTSSDSTTSSLGSSTTPSNCDCSTSSSPSTTCPPWEPAPQVRFEKTSSFITLSKGETGYVNTFKAASDIRDEKITYNIKSVDPTGSENKFKITEKGEIYIKEELNEATYHISLTATGKESKSQDEIMVFLQIEQKIIDCSDNTFQVDRLINTKVIEGEEKKILDSNGARLEFTSDNSDIFDWFEFNEKNDLQVLSIDREDERIKSLLAPQIQVKIKVSSVNTPPQLRYNFSSNSLSQYAARDYSQPEYNCLSIKNIDKKADTMVILVSVEDVNDNPPVFIEDSPLVVGYPEPKLIEFIAPPYLIKVTATDEDFGDNAKIKYTTNKKNFIADPENGIIFLGDEIEDDSEFKVIAEDNNGNGGNQAELIVKVKLLKEEHISVITIKNIAYSEIEDKIKEISSSTKQTVKYLSSTALPKVTEQVEEDEEEKKFLKLYSNDEKVPAVRIILYALDSKNEIIPAKDFKKIADDTDLGIEINVEEYIAASPNEDHEEEDTTGWIAAVSTLSVLLALVIIGGLLSYIFYFRPRMMDSPSSGYKKHTNRDSMQIAPIETKIESTTTLSDRRPTGFPTGFNLKDLDEEEDEDYDNVFEKEDEPVTKMEIDVQKDEVNSDSEISNTESEQKPKQKAGVKFDTNVTEIEIEIEEF